MGLKASFQFLRDFAVLGFKTSIENLGGFAVEGLGFRRVEGYVTFSVSGLQLSYSSIAIEKFPETPTSLS